MPIIYSSFGNRDEELWNFYDPSDGSEDLSILKAASGATTSRASFAASMGGESVSLMIDGQFSQAATGVDLITWIRANLNSTVSKIDVSKNGSRVQTEEYVGSISFNTLINLWDSIPTLQSGFAGDDTFNGSTSPQSGGDNINGYGGNDSFYGNGDGGDNSPDRFFGGSGTDTAFYRGPKSNYTITSITQIWDPQTKSNIPTNNQGFRIKDNTGLDGTDELFQVEFAQFSDQKLSLASDSSSGSSSTSSGSSNSSSSATLPVIAAAPNRGNVTLIALSDGSVSTFYDPEGKKPEDPDFFSAKISQESSSSKLIAEFTYKTLPVRLEIIGNHAPDLKSYTDLRALLNKYPNATVSNASIFLQNTKISEEIYATPQRALDLIDSEYNLQKLQQLYSGNDVFIGSFESEPDDMNGYAGDDVFYGNNDNQDSDIIHGGDGTDTAVYRGKYSDYTIQAVNWLWDPIREKSDLAGFYIVDKVANRDGDDHLYQVERLQFSNYVVSLPDLRIIGTVGPASSSSSTTSSGASTGTTTAGSTGTTSGTISGTTGGSTSSTTTTTTTTTTPATTTPAATTPVAPIIPNGTEKSGSDAVDRLQGGSGPDVIRSGGGSDVIIGSDGNDYIDGGTGVDQLSYSSRAGSISFAVDTGGNVQVRLGSKTDTLVSVERISFTDKAYALDLDGSAGKAAKAIIAAFGKNTVSQYLGIALTMTDKGASITDLAKIVVDNKMLPSDNGQFVQTVFNNVVGRAPNALELLQFKGILDRGEMTTTQLLTLAASTSFAETVVNEIAIAGVALEYAPTLA
jgi:Ca2+-binding RTX toxin-like protein